MRGTKKALSPLSGAEKKGTSVVSLPGPPHQPPSIEEAGRWGTASQGVRGADFNRKGRSEKGRAGVLKLEPPGEQKLQGGGRLWQRLSSQLIKRPGSVLSSREQPNAC